MHTKARDPLAVEMEGLRAAVEHIIAERDALKTQNGEMEDLLTSLINADSSTLLMHKQRAKQYLRDTDRP